MKKVLVVLFGLFTLTLKVDARVAEYGICAGKEITGEGYCTLDSGVYIDSEKFDPSYNFLTNGKPAVVYSYYGTVSGKRQDMFCIDPNLDSPPRGYSYNYARGLEPNGTNIDTQFSKVYVSLINAAVYAYKNGGSCATIDDCLKPFLQASNILMRVFMIKHRFNLTGKPGDSRLDVFRNIQKQLDGETVTGVKLETTGVNQYSVLERWYNNASTLSNVGRKFRVTTTLDTSHEIISEDDGTRFTRIVPVKVSGLDQFRLGADWDITNPSVKITGFECSTGLTCELDADRTRDVNGGTDVNLNNLLETGTNEVVIYVKVTGNNDLLKTTTKGTLVVKVQKYHILDTDNLAVIRSEKYEIGRYQRMLILMPTTPQKAEINISLDLPPYCKVETDASGNKKYKLGTREVSISEYVNAGCCIDVDVTRLSDSELSVYEAKCGGTDTVHLEQKCGAGTCNDNAGTLPGILTDSYVKQMSMNSIMSQVRSWEDSLSINSEIYGRQTKENMSLWRDHSFNSSLENNPYCKIYTSEENHMYYPTTTTAQSGRFFVFAKDASGNYLQPYVEGTIYSTFHTAYDMWKTDYQNAIVDEKAKYELWQEAEQIKNAHETDNVTDTPMKHQIGCGTEEEPNKQCWCHYTKHVATPSKKYYKGTYDEKELDAYEDVWYTGHTDEESNTSPDTYDTTAQSTYEVAKQKRIDIQNQKTECQNTAVRYQSDWKYILEPNLTFNYNQKYYNSSTGNIDFLPTKVVMSISKSGDTPSRYFPNYSTEINDPTSYSGTVNNVNYNGREGSTYLGPIYGGGDSRLSTPFNDVDTTTDYTRNYEGIKIYFRPEKEYYSLVPSGLVKTSEEIFSTTPNVHLGYVFNVIITNYQGEYETWFTISKNGHLESTPSGSSKNDSNIQKSINSYLQDNSSLFTDSSNRIDATEFSSKCIYCNREMIFERPCEACDDFKPEYIYRTVNPSDIDPNDRKNNGKLGNNWSNKKGEAAEKRISDLARADSIYNDSTKENLEYEFNLSTQKMQEIKNANKSTNYYDFNLTCNRSGKECVSDFVTTYASYTEGRSKYKYYNASSDKFEVGTMATLVGAEYPDLEDCPNKLCP